MKKIMGLILAIVMMMAMIPILTMAEPTLYECDNEDCEACVEGCSAEGCVCACCADDEEKCGECRFEECEGCVCACCKYEVTKVWVKELFDTYKDVVYAVVGEGQTGDLPNGTKWMTGEEKAFYDRRLQDLEDIIENEIAEQWQVDDAGNEFSDALDMVRVVVVDTEKLSQGIAALKETLKLAKENQLTKAYKEKSAEFKAEYE